MYLSQFRKTLTDHSAETPRTRERPCQTENGMSIDPKRYHLPHSIRFMSDKSVNFRTLLMIHLLLLFLMPPFTVSANESARLTGQKGQAENQKIKTTPDAQNSVLVGIEGIYRVGHWTGIRRIDDKPIESIRTRDGDGVEVIYRQSETVTGNRWCYAIPGSEAAPLILESASAPILETRFPTQGSPSRGAAMIPLSMPWVVAIGDALGIDQFNANKLLERDASVAVSKPENGKGLPDSELGYAGVSLIVVGGSGKEILRELSEDQQQAIINWVQSGGRLLLTLGSSSTALLEQSPWLKRLVPLTEITIAKIDPSALETFTSSQKPLDAFEGLRLPTNQGSTLLMGRTLKREPTPLVVEYNAGLGQVIAVSADLEDRLFEEWPERMDLLTQIVGKIIEPDQELAGQKNRSTAYNDLAGQLRTTLDQFEIKKGYSFSFLSLIILAFLAFIGPLDFFLLNHFLGRPMLGWITFPASAIGICVLLVLESRAVDDPATALASKATASNSVVDTTVPPCSQQWNRLEVIDIDTTIQMGITRSLHYLYSHNPKILNVRIESSDTMDQIGVAKEPRLTTPFGYPGESFGGIQIGLEDSRLPFYSVNFEESRDSTSIQGMPIASRSSKGIESRVAFTPTLNNEEPVTRRPGSELLQGKLTNPINADILNGMLIYRNWTYLLPTRFPAGSKINSLDTLRQKNFRWQLSRQQALESSSETEPWNPADTKALDRIGEMILFHEAAGGTRYTTLRHAPLSSLDLSHVLSDDRCILFGQLENAATKIDLQEDDGKPLQGRRETFVRVILPVIDVRNSR